MHFRQSLLKMTLTRLKVSAPQNLVHVTMETKLIHSFIHYFDFS